MNLDIITNDVYFKNSLEILVQENDTGVLSNKVVFDLGRRGVLLLRTVNYFELTYPIKLLELMDELFIIHYSHFEFFQLLTDNTKTLYRHGERLTECQLNTLTLLLLQKPCREVSSSLSISVKTVNAHKLNGLKKLGMTSVAELSVLLRSWGEWLQKKSMS